MTIRSFWPWKRSTSAPLFELRDLNRSRRAANQAHIRALSRSVNVGDESVLCRVLGRYKMYVDATDVGLSGHLMLDGFWEMWLTEALAGVVRPGMTVVDVGANLGYFTLLMADLVGSGGKVHAFEPNPQLVKRLARSLTLNGFQSRVALHELALGDGQGSFRLVVPESEPKNGHLVEVESGSADMEGCVRTARLDGFDALKRADVVKIDADTAELAIWRGMAGIFAEHHPMTIFLEFNSLRYDDPAAFLREIGQRGFSITHLDFLSGVQPADMTEILHLSAHEDLTLVLTRG